MKNKKSKSAAAPATAPANAPDLARNADDKIWKDSRFAHLVSDPRFKNIAKSTRAVKIDKRFESMFKDDKFNVKYTVDKRGRPTKKSTSDDLKKYYEMSSGDEEEEQRKELEAISKDDDDVLVQPKKQKEKKRPAKADEDEATADAVDEDDLAAQLGSSDEEELPSTLRDKLKDLTVDYARGESALWSDDSSDDESSEDGEGAGGELFIEHVWGALDLDAPRTDESTPRLAVCNMDWDRIRAADIMVLCNSFLPPGGAILSVTIYPSEFGKERMAEEELKGPQELTEKKLGAAKDDRAADSDSDFDLGTDDEADDAEESEDGTKARQDDEAEEGDDYNMEKLRQYQLNRLKYYYAVIECNCVGAADKIYAECDGMEYESTATKLDLRFVPDDMVFDDEPKDVCREMPDTSKYMPRLFTTTALQQAKVELTWDENDLDRKELNDKLAAGKLSEVGDHELRKYVAYSSEEEEEEVEDEVAEKEEQTKKMKSKKGGKKKAANGAEEDEISNGGGKKKNDSLSKYKALLAEINEKESEKKNNRIEMEFSWGIGMKDKASKADDPSDDDDSAADSDDNDAKVSKSKSKKTDPEQTHFDRIVEFKREKKRARKEEQKLKRKKFRKGAAGDDDSGSEIGGNGNLDSDSDGDIPDGIDLNDPYFAEEFANGDFEAPKAKKSSKNKKKKRGDEEVDSEEEREKAELALLLDDGADGDKRAHFSLKKIQAAESETKSKRKRKAVLRRSKKQNVAEKEMLHADDFSIDTADDRFKAIYSSHLFSIDPTNPNFKKTKAMDALIEAKLKRAPTVAAERDQKTDEPEAKKPKRNVETSMLVKSIKRKVQQAKQ